MEYKVRFAELSDENSIYELYKIVAKISGGIATKHNEITTEYITAHNLISALNRGISLVIENPLCDSEIVAALHCYKPIPAVFNYILSELTIVVHPDHQGNGLRKLIFSYLLEYVEEN